MTPSPRSGVAVGSTRAEVEGAYALRVEETTLGTEFSGGGLSGVFSGTGPGATALALLWYYFVSGRAARGRGGHGVGEEEG